MKKSDHAQFLKLLDTCLVSELGAEKVVSREASKTCRAPQLFSYHLQTIYGLLVLTPDVPWSLTGKRVKRYDCTVFGKFPGEGTFPHTYTPYLGRFPQSGPHPIGANSYNGKWNFHFGPREADELEVIVSRIAREVSSLLVPMETEN